MATKRKVQQFFTFKGMNLALCDDGTVWGFEMAFVKEGNTNVEKIVWRQRPELETPGT